MSEDGVVFLFSRGDEVFCRSATQTFNGTVCGYVQRLSRSEDGPGVWLCVVESNMGNLFMVPDKALEKIKKQQPLARSI